LALSNDEIERLYRVHARGVLAYFARRVRRADVATDLMAETFALAYRDRRQFRGQDDEQAVAWIYGIARHQLSGYRRRGEVERRALAELGVQPRALQEQEYERIEELAGVHELAGRVRAGVADLGTEQRDALLLRVVHGHDYDEVARRTGVSEQTARARVSRALKALRTAQGGELGHA
jgi:RNA polymerase sigma-70 factor (ECF subfamily)